MPITASDKLLVHVPSPPPPGWLDAVRRRFPQLRVRWEVAAMLPGASDLENADMLPDEAWEGVTMLVLYPPPSPARMAGVRFVHLISAGSDRWVRHEKYRDPRVVFCSGSGCHPPQIAEWVMATWLSHSHHLNVWAEQQKNHLWSASVREHPTTDSLGLRVGILGYGAIGRHCARIAHALGMQIYAYTRRPRPTPESRRFAGYTVPGTGDPSGALPAMWFYGGGRTAVNNFLAQDLDLLVLALPAGPDTERLIGREQFGILSRRRTFLSNVARGVIVDTDALVEALRGGFIRGAALDVTDPEPLPKDHPLWSCPNVFISPHISWQSTTHINRVADLVLQNLDRLDMGEPLINEIKRY